MSPSHSVITMQHSIKRHTCHCAAPSACKRSLFASSAAASSRDTGAIAGVQGGMTIVRSVQSMCEGLHQGQKRNSIHIESGMSCWHAVVPSSCCLTDMPPSSRNSVKDEEGAQTLTPSGVIAPVTSEDVAAYQTRFNRLQAEGAPGWKVRV